MVLAFDVKVEREAQEMADSLGIRVFTAEIIYHLFDEFTAYRDKYKKGKQDEFRRVAVFGCKLKCWCCHERPSFPPPNGPACPGAGPRRQAPW